MRNAVLLLLIVPFLAPARAHAWNATGHMTIAKLAWEQMDAGQREAAYQLLQQHPHKKQFFDAQPRPKGVGEAEWYFVQASTWADWLRGFQRSKRPEDMAIAAYHKGPRHYINLPIVHGPDVELFKDKKLDPPDENIVTALAEYLDIVKDVNAKPADRAVALCWVLHLTGDIHQPLHCVAFFSKEYPTGDLGGNLRWVKDGKRPTNLHAYWDDVLGRGDTFELVKDNVALLTRADYERGKFVAELEKTKIMDWAEEGKAIAVKTVYLEGKLPGLASQGQLSDEQRQMAPALPEGYAEAAVAVARRRAALAGHRMADQMRVAFAKAKS
jgi:hypothetical protein